jgi:hypothetical protein
MARCPAGGVSTARHRTCVERATETFGASERFAGRILGQHRSTQRKIAKKPDDEPALTADIIALATRYGRHGYRRIAAERRVRFPLGVPNEINYLAIRWRWSCHPYGKYPARMSANDG